MSELHTDDTFMYENCLVGDAGMDEDPLVNRITHQRGPKAPSTESLMSRHEGVDWSQAPDWANYWAMDADEEAFWYNSEPVISTLSLACWKNTNEKVKIAPSFDFPSYLWKESLEGRPEESKPDQEKALDDLVRDAEELGLYDNEYCDELGHPSELVDWSKAPDWASYWAMDISCVPVWHEEHPVLIGGYWLSDGKSFVAPSFGFPIEHWEKSLITRYNSLQITVKSSKARDWYAFPNELNGPIHRQVSGSHYNKYPIQPAEYCYKNGLNNLQSEAISYITRYGDKGGKTDLEKAIHTLEMLIHMEYGE